MNHDFVLSFLAACAVLCVLGFAMSGAGYAKIRLQQATSDARLSIHCLASVTRDCLDKTP